jgi:hypothetical protein
MISPLLRCLQEGLITGAAPQSVNAAPDAAPGSIAVDVDAILTTCAD